MLRSLLLTLVLVWLVWQGPPRAVAVDQEAGTVTVARWMVAPTGSAGSSQQLVITPQRDPDRRDSVSLETTGNDPSFWFQLPTLGSADRDWLFSVDYFCAQGIRNVQWFVGYPAKGASAVDAPSFERAEGWTNYTLNLSEMLPEVVANGQPLWIRMDLGQKRGVRMQLARPIIRTMNDSEVQAKQNAEAIRNRKLETASAIETYLSRDWPATIESARAIDGRVLVRGRLEEPIPADPLRVLVRSGERIAALDPTPQQWAEAFPVELDSGGVVFSASFAVSQTAGQRFQLVRLESGRPVAVSACRYLDNHDAAARSLAAPEKLSAAKGLTCLDTRFEPAELRDLGLEHGSVNVVLNGLVRSKRSPGHEKFESGGRAWWVNAGRLRSLDRNVLVCHEAGLQVAAILLVTGRDDPTDSLVHPEFDSAGTYAMPNLTDPNAVALYDATLRFLADRYARVDARYGRIDHWIVHNEVDYGWQWTNMGEQPMAVFADHYIRSMRMVDAAVRSFNPHGRVFISLTHRWNVPDDRPWKTYAPRTLINQLLRSSRVEGDFPWGVAYHPYPESLWDAATWDDQQTSDDFDTRLITVKNLQVLDRFMHQPSSRTRSGEVRPVICSEQGYHAAEDDPEALRIQAAALLYTWQKLRQCPSVIAFDYHRPADHPREGGLRLGLRGLPSGENPIGKPKPAWEIFRAIGTESEAEWVDHYQSVWTSAAPSP